MTIMNRNWKLTGVGVALTMLMSAGVGQAASLTGNPAADGWHHEGHSLQSGVYSRGSGNLGFDIYTSHFTVTDSSTFALKGHEGAAYDGYYGLPSGGRQWDTTTARSWSAGDVVVGLGGVFSDISAGDAGWGGFTGAGVNDNLPSGEGRLRVQGKFGTSDATWSTSTIAPDAGDGSASTSDGGAGTIFARSSGFLFLGDNAWETYSGEVMGLQEPGHISRVGTSIATDVARLVWDYDEDADRPLSWQLLLNVSMIADDDPAFASLVPGVGSPVIASVQTSPYTDALVTVVPLPAAAWAGLALLGAMGGVAGVKRKLRGGGDEA